MLDGVEVKRSDVCLVRTIKGDRSQVAVASATASCSALAGTIPSLEAPTWHGVTRCVS